jgi:quercetin dioxygenase-like cupin family protein
MNPYSQIKTDNGIIRTFSEEVDSHELIWHRDKNNRIVEVLEGEGWKFQMDNQVPIILEVGDVITIPMETYHRIGRGRTPLKIKIIEE